MNELAKHFEDSSPEKWSNNDESSSEEQDNSDDNQSKTSTKSDNDQDMGSQKAAEDDDSDSDSQTTSRPPLRMSYEQFQQLKKIKSRFSKVIERLRERNRILRKENDDLKRRLQEAEAIVNDYRERATIAKQKPQVQVTPRTIPIQQTTPEEPSSTTNQETSTEEQPPPSPATTIIID